MSMEKLQKWIDRDIPRSKCDVQLACGTVGAGEEYKFYIYTETNKFAIYARYTGDTGEDDSYLGCVAQSRKSRPGEDWFRGNDLPDGPLTEKTWNAILKAIIRYELKDVAKSDARKNIADTIYPM